MPGVRIDRFLASTAIVLLLTGAAGSAFAEPKFGLIVDSAPPPAATTPSQAIETGQPAAAKPEPMNQPAPPAATSKPLTSAEKSVVAIANSEDPNNQALPAATAAPEEPADQPAEAP